MQNQPWKFDALWIALNAAMTKASGDAPAAAAGVGNQRRARNMGEWVSVNCRGRYERTYEQPQSSYNPGPS
jgi:hypothetical protein